MEIKSFVFNPFYENTYVLWDETQEAIIVDPGCYEKYERDELISFINASGLKVKYIVNTHCHIDHVLGNYFMKSEFQAPLWIPVNELEIYRAVKTYARQWGISQYQEAEPDDLMENDGYISFGNVRLDILFVPGHSPGHQAFYSSDQNKLIGGDILFKESIGRTDLPGGNHNDLIQNIQTKIYSLPEKTEVFPGHGPPTTVGHEKAHNPFVKGL